jgi:Sulfotransferase family
VTAGTPGLLVTGMARSGTSWVGKMVQAGRGVVYLNEPLNPGHPPGRSPGVLDAEVTHQYQYIGDGDEEWQRAFAGTLALRYGFARELLRNNRPYDLARLVKYGTAMTLGRWLGRRPLLDDPFALYATPWLVRTFGVRAVVLVRDPVAIAGSYRRLGWKMRFDEVLAQPRLVADLLGPEHVGEVRAAQAETDPVRSYALMWRVSYGIVDRHYRDLPGVLIARYEDFARDPLTSFEALYRHLGLEFTERAQRAVQAASSGGGDDERAHEWRLRGGLARTAYRPMDSAAMLEAASRRLVAAEIETVRGLTADVAARFYPPTPPPQRPEVPPREVTLPSWVGRSSTEQG